MSFKRRLDVGKLSAPTAALVMILAFATICFLLVRDGSAPVSATPPEAGPSSPAADAPAASNAAEAEQGPPVQIPAEQMPAERTLAEQTPSGPAAPNQDADERRADQVSAPEQSTFKSRRALETIDPRELLRRAPVPSASIPN